MKKILFATTALVASAGIASAQGVEVSGSAEVGVVGGERYTSAATGEVVDQLWTDVEVRFTMSGEADNGLSYGANIDLDEATNANGTDDGGATFFLAFGGARLDVGDTDGAFDAALAEVGLVGSIDDSETWHVGYNGNAGLDNNTYFGAYDNQVARFSYSVDAFTGHASVESDDLGESDPIYGIGFTYNANLAGVNLGFGIGHQRAEIDAANTRGLAAGEHSVTGVSVSTTLDNGLQAVVNYSERDQDNFAETQTHSAIGLAYTMNALSVGVNYGVNDNVGGVAGNTNSGYGVAANYDLGGGLEVQAGYGRNLEVGGVDDDADSYSLGLAMSF